MIVIADTSPLVVLINVNCVHILPTLFATVTVPPRIAEELKSELRPARVREFMANPPEWLKILAPTTVEAIPNLHAGELEAISLALEIRADLLLIDDREGREAAIERGLKTARTAALLTDAANRGLIPDLRSIFDWLRTTNFHVTDKVLDSLLKMHYEHARKNA